MSEAIKPEIGLGDGLFQQASFVIMVLYVYTRLRTQYVVMSELHCVVDFRLSEPRLFIPGGEDLDGHILPHPGAPPHLRIPAFACKQSKEN